MYSKKSSSPSFKGKMGFTVFPIAWFSFPPVKQKSKLHNQRSINYMNMCLSIVASQDIYKWTLLFNEIIFCIFRCSHCIQIMRKLMRMRKLPLISGMDGYNTMIRSLKMLDNPCPHILVLKKTCIAMCKVLRTNGENYAW